MATPDKLFVYGSSALTIELNKVKDGDILFTFNEYGVVSLTLTSNLHQVELECSDYVLDKSPSSPPNNLLKLKPYKHYFISSLEEDLCYFPGLYPIIITNRKNNTVKRCYFEVLINQQIGLEGFANLVKTMEEILPTICSDFFAKKGQHNTIQTANVGAICLDMAQNSQQLTNQIYQLDLLFEMKKEPVLSHRNGRQNSKTAYLNNVKKRQSDNRSYSLHPIKTYDIKENQLLKYYLYRIKRILTNYYDQISITLETKKINLDSTKLSRFQQNELQSFEKVEKDRQAWAPILPRLKSLINLCQNLLTLSPLCDLAMTRQKNPSLKFIQTPSYMAIKKLHDKLVNPQQASVDSYYKKHFEIFELAGFVFLHQILTSLGFELVTTLTNMSFKSGDCFTFTRDECQVDIYYDQYCRKYRDVEGDGFVSINSFRCQPDFAICIKKPTTVNCLILEMKYRQVFVMQKNMSSLIWTLDEYSQLKYRHQGQFYQIDKVFLIYPNCQENFELMTHNGYFVGLNLKDKTFENNLNFLRLKEEIIKYIS